VLCYRLRQHVKGYFVGYAIEFLVRKAVSRFLPRDATHSAVMPQYFDHLLSLVHTRRL